MHGSEASGKQVGGYDRMLIEHIKHARNYRAMPDADARIEAVNPLCGDRLDLFLKWDGEHAADISFQCECCGISMASASALTEMLRGRTRAEMLTECDRFLARIADRATRDAEPGDATVVQHALLRAAREYPARAGCAALAWRSLRDALRSEERAC